MDTTLSFPGAALLTASSISWALTSFLHVSILQYIVDKRTRRMTSRQKTMFQFWLGLIFDPSWGKNNSFTLKVSSFIAAVLALSSTSYKVNPSTSEGSCITWWMGGGVKILNIQNEQTWCRAVTPLSVRPATTAQPSSGKLLAFSCWAFFSSTNLPRDLSTILHQPIKFKKTIIYLKKQNQKQKKPLRSWNCVWFVLFNI